MLDCAGISLVADINGAHYTGVDTGKLPIQAPLARERPAGGTASGSRALRQSPGASPSRVQRPTLKRTRRNVGRATAAVIPRTPLFHPSAGGILSHGPELYPRTR